MTKVKHFDNVLIFADSVVNENRAVLEFSYAGTFSDRATHPGESAQQIHVIQYGVAKARGGFAIIIGNMADDFSEVV
jgi:hypothetical protein